MLTEAAKKAATRTRNPKARTINFGPWGGGLVTARPAEMLKPSELSEAANVIYEETNRIRTRPGSRLIFSGTYTDPDRSGLYEMGAITALGYYRVDGTWYYCICALAADGTDGFFTYEEGDVSATLIGDLEGEGFLLYFNQQIIIFDGGRVKYWDGGSSLKLLYDNGLGVDGYQIYRRNETDNYTLPLGATENTEAAAVKYTTTAWPLGFTLPPTTVYATLSKRGTWPAAVEWEDGVEWGDGVEWWSGGVAPVYARIRNAATGALVAEAEIVNDARELSVLAAEYSADLTVATELERSTEYYVSIEFTRSGAQGQVNVHGTDYAILTTEEPSDGTTDVTYRVSGTTITESPAPSINYLISLKPGLGPKAEFGITHKSRIFAMEGSSGDNPTYLWYSGAYDPFDWSTENGGGHIDNKRLIGSIASWYQAVWVFGTRRDPALFRLTGETPSAYAMEDTLQKVGAHWKSTVVTPDDVYFLHPGGMDSVLSIQEFGDVRAASQADNIADKIRDGYSEESIAGYEPNYGLVLLKMPDDPDAYVFHTRLKTGRAYGDRQMTFHPISTWRHSWQE